MKRLLAPLVLLSACSGDDGPVIDAAPAIDAPPSPTCLEANDHSDFTWIQDKVLRTSCANFMACHDSTQPAGNLDLTAANAYAELVNVPSFYFTDWMRVVPGDPDMSYLMVRMRCHNDPEPDGTGCLPGPLDGGSLMPPNSNKICQQKIDAIVRWIEAGAMND
jgi:hypothetical protein